MNRSDKKIFLRDNFYKNSQKYVNQNLKTFQVNTCSQVENRFFSYRAGVFSSITSGTFGGVFARWFHK